MATIEVRNGTYGTPSDHQPGWGKDPVEEAAKAGLVIVFGLALLVTFLMRRR